uniref:SAND domain-containing protein n=1 Tax=Esox lucius TaxID=8010 RepID=A0A3P8Y2A8_ESOLU
DKKSAMQQLQIQLRKRFKKQVALFYFEICNQGYVRQDDCILVDDQWFTPTGFEVFGGKKSSKNWKTSIRCEGITLAKLIQVQHTDIQTDPGTAYRHTNCSRYSIQTYKLILVQHTDIQMEVWASPGGSQVVGLRKTVFQVTCGVLSGMLHKDRFASGTRGKSIRTERSWMTPMEFLRGGSVMADTTWKKDILCDGNPLSVLIENEVLIIHSVLCECNLCDPNQEQVNDDDCFICRLQGSLICCDECPRSFHQGCHLPNVDDALLGLVLFKIEKNTFWVLDERLGVVHLFCFIYISCVCVCCCKHVYI